MKTPAPKHRAIIHLAADMRKGAGAHSVARKPGPTAEEWDDDLTSSGVTIPEYPETMTDADAS